MTRYNFFKIVIGQSFFLVVAVVGAHVAVVDADTDVAVVALVDVAFILVSGCCRSTFSSHFCSA